MPEAQSANSSASVRPIDLDRPWLGLRSFGEEHTDLFFGRQTERNEILRCVEHRHITVLYGRSGLGKTSLIRAGLTRDLLTAGYQPIFHRIRYGPEEAPPAIQLIAVLSDVYEAPISQNTDLYVLLHDPALGFCGPFARYKPPVFLLDQFEEVFTLGAEVNRTLKSRRDVLAEVRDVLAILGQNFIPEELAAHLETDEGLYGRLDQESHAGRVVLSLRDDYVFALDRWRRELPSVGDNRYELLPLTGKKALLAVVEPGKLRDPEHPIVTAECASEIVRFVAGDKEQCELDELVVVPPLLSLICEQLNAYRIKHGREQIEPTFQKDTADEILEDYYQSRFRDRPVELRMLVEEHLLSAEGHRQPVNVDTAERMLEKVCPNNDGRRLLDYLVAERLLTIVEHGSLRRFELTHDILCPIARRSRDARRELEEKNRLAKEAELAQQRQHEAELKAAEQQRIEEGRRKEAEQKQREAEEKQREAEARERESESLRTQAVEAERRTRKALMQSRIFLILAIFALGVAVFYAFKSAWSERAAVHAAQRATKARDEAEKLIEFMMFDLRDKLEPIGRLSLLNDVNKRVEAYYDSFAGEEKSPDVLRRQGVMFNNHGDVLHAEGNLGAALTSYRDGLAITQKLAGQNPKNTLWQGDLAVSYNKIGDVLDAQGDLVGALKSFRDSLAIRQKLASQEPGNAGWQRDLAFSYERIGDVSYDQGHLDGALKSFRDSLDIRQKLASKEPDNAGGQRDLAFSYERIGDVLRNQGDLDGALKNFRNSFAIRQKLATQEPGDAGWLSNLAASYERIGDVLRDQGDLDGALKSFRVSLDIRQKLATQDPGNVGWQRDPAFSYERIGDVLRDQGDLAGALKSFRVSLDIHQKLATQEPDNAGGQRDLAFSYERIGDVLRDQGDLAGALKSFRDSLAIRQKLASQEPDNAGGQRDLAFSYERIGDVLHDQGDLNGALRSLRDSLAICQKLASQDPSNAGWQRNSAASYQRIGNVLRDQGDLTGALKNYRDDLVIAQKLAGQDPNNAAWEGDLAFAYWCVGEAWSRVEPDSKLEARGMIKKGRDILWTLSKRVGLTAPQQTWLDAIEKNLGER
jgi:tetratricopeptide (TPR) repeat protein